MGGCNAFYAAVAEHRVPAAPFALSVTSQARSLMAPHDAPQMMLNVSISKS